MEINSTIPRKLINKVIQEEEIEALSEDSGFKFYRSRPEVYLLKNAVR